MNRDFNLREVLIGILFFALLLILVNASVVTLFISDSRASKSKPYNDESETKQSREDIGKVNFRISCSKAAQRKFNRALALLHHMMYLQAEGGKYFIKSRKVLD